MIHYSHRQYGYVILLSLLVIPVMVYFLPVSDSSIKKTILLVACVIMLICATLFYSLSIEIDATSLKLRFGIGLIRKSISLKDIQRCEIIRYPLYYGYGIHMTKEGTLYNVSGREAVKLYLADGKIILVGTDDAANFSRNLEAIIGHR